MTQTLRRPVDEAIARAVAFLRERQLPHGEFMTLLAPDKEMSAGVFDSTPFTTSFVLYALTHVGNPLANDIIEKAGTYLLSQMEFGGVWRYWSSRHPNHAHYPPDLDDVSCISFALKYAGRKVPNNRWIFRCCRDSLGRFKVWAAITPQNCSEPWFWIARSIGDWQAKRPNGTAPAANAQQQQLQSAPVDWEEMDPVVNANAVLYLGEGAEMLPAIIYVREAVLDEGSGGGLWYEDRLSLYYAVARAFRHSAPSFANLKEHIVARILERAARNEFFTPLHTAMAASVLETFAPESPLIGRLVQDLLTAQREDGSWDKSPFYCAGPNYWGSEELTTGLCIEALARCTTH
jgi:hypothetical protein